MTSSPRFPILYEDNHLIVIEKPVNMPSQSDPSGDLDVLTAMKEDLKARYQKTGNVYLGLVHRLDRPVGGAMLLAKTSKAASRMSEAVRTRSIEKEYVTVVHGKPKTHEDRLVHYLWKDKSKNKVFSVRRNHKQAKEAILEYRIIDTRDQYSLVHIRLHTGRSHQIRVQMAAIGCPLYGDQKYGTKVNRPGQQLALWSCKLAVHHPVKKHKLVWYSSPPLDSFPWNLWNRDQYPSSEKSKGWSK